MLGYDPDDDTDRLDEARLKNADCTATLLAALKFLEKKDFTTMMGSGILMRLTDLSGKTMAPEFCFPAEDMEKIKSELIRSLRTYLERRTWILQRELGDINAAVGAQKDPT